MAVNYLGKRRLEKIFFNYIADRKDLTKRVKADCKECGKDIIMNYRRYRGWEWLEVSSYDETNKTEIHCSMCTESSENGCRIAMSEKQRPDSYDCIEFKEVFHGCAFYTKDFCPYAGEKKLCCFEIFKSPPQTGNNDDDSDSLENALNHFVINTLDCSINFRGTYKECQKYLDEHIKDTLAGTLTIETEQSYISKIKHIMIP